MKNNVGKITQVLGAVVDVQFPAELPPDRGGDVHRGGHPPRPLAADVAQIVLPLGHGCPSWCAGPLPPGGADHSAPQPAGWRAVAPCGWYAIGAAPGKSDQVHSTAQDGGT